MKPQVFNWYLFLQWLLIQEMGQLKMKPYYFEVLHIFCRLCLNFRSFLLGDFHFLILWLLSKSIYYGNKNAPSKIVFRYSSKYVKIQSLQHTIIIPKRKLAYTKRSMFYPCGACRQNCTTEVIRCDSCSSWFNYSFENLTHQEVAGFRGSIDFQCFQCLRDELGPVYSFTSTL
jgi:hypothetical protein